jgi:dienelactone hydrolase
MSASRAAVLFAALAALPVAAGAQGLTRAEIVPIETLTLTNRQFLLGDRNGRPVTIGGELHMPGGAEKLPAVIMLHGAAGVGANLDRWANALNGIGIAVFVLDSHAGRLAARAVESPAQISHLTMLHDAYRALDLLSRDPRIDPARIALMGFSKGGLAALYGGMERFQRTYGGDAAFAAYLPFYPPCNYRWIDDDKVSGQPIRIFQGEADDWSPIAACRRYAEALRASGRDAAVIGYAGAGHVFDGPHLAPGTRLPSTPSVLRCAFIEAPEGIIVNVETGRLLAPDDACVGRGVTVGYHAEAHAAAIADVTAFLTGVFKLP